MTTRASSRSTSREEWCLPGNSVVLRLPLQPFESVVRLAAASAEGDAASGPDAALDSLLRDSLRDRLIREAVFLASPDLDEHIERWLAGPEPAAPSLIRALTSYLTRMATRATPFGLFAAVCVVRVGPQTRLDPGQSRLQRRTRLDFGYLADVLMKTAAEPGIRSELLYAPNSSLYRAGSRVRLLEGRITAGRVSYTRTAFEDDEALELVLRSAAGGRSLSELAAILVAEGASADEANAYLNQMVDDQLLVGDLGPTLTGVDAARHAAARLSSEHPVAQTLSAVSAQLRKFDESQTPVEPDRYRAVSDQLAVLEVPFKASRLFQVDAAVSAPDATLSREVLTAACSSISLLASVAPAAPDQLSEFRTAFERRYGDREIPLSEALDEEVGLWFGPPISLHAEGAPLLHGLRAAPGGAPEARFTGADHRRLRLLLHAVETGEHVELTDDDLAALSPAAAPALPDSLALIAVLASPSTEALDRGEFSLLLKGAAGPSGVRLLGRFCDTSEELEELVRQHVLAEEALHPDVVFAEVVHLPEGRIGNVVARPVLRDHEIVFLGTSGADPTRQIRIDELTVAVRDGRVVLRCPRLGREVRPRNTTAHNTSSQALPAYRFLAAVQNQHVRAGLGWSWGPVQSLPFLPRVQRGRFVLSRRQWNLSPEESSSLAMAAPAERGPLVRDLCQRRQLPEWVALAAGDNELVLNLETGFGQHILCHEAKKGYLQLVELWPLPADLCVGSKDRHFVHELLIPLVRSTTDAAPPAATLSPPSPSPAQAEHLVFAPGSEWLSAKLYTGKATADVILGDVLAKVVEELTTDGIIDQWFFLRFADPDWHVRLRLHTPPGEQNLQSLSVLHHSVRGLLDDGRLSRMEVDSYMPEDKRYGGRRAMPVVEQIFHHDSTASQSMVRATVHDLRARWRLALVGTDRLLQDSGFDLLQRRQLVRQWRDGLVGQQGETGVAARRWAGKVMRSEGATLRKLLGERVDDPSVLRALPYLGARSSAVHPLLMTLRELDQEGLLTARFTSIVGSLCHMHVNRMLRGAQRTQELVIYDLLDRLYASAGARPDGSGGK